MMTTLHDIGLANVIGFGANNMGDDAAAATTTAAISAAMYYAYWHEMAVFFPPGEYAVTGRLLGAEETNNMRSRAHMLIGSTKGERPVIRLIDNAPGFQDVDNPRAVVHLYTARDDDNPDPNNEFPGNGFNQGMRNIDIALGSGNPGAAGLRFNGAQDSIIENVKVTAIGGFCGFYNLPGTNAVLHNLEVAGGKYGIYTNGQGSQWPAISGLTLTGQTDYAIYNMQTVPVIVGFKIVKDTAPVIYVEDAGWSQSYSGGSLSLIDGTIEVLDDSGGFFTNDASRSIVMKNIYYGVADAGWRLVDEYAITIKDTSADGGQIGRTLIDGVEGFDNFITDSVAVLAPPVDLMLRHLTDPADYPSPDAILEAIADGKTINGMTVANAKDHGVIGAPTGADSTSRDGPDDTDALQNVIDNYDLVFLPKGKYLTMAPTLVGANNQLIGVTNYMSEIRPHEDWQPTESSPGTVIKTVDDANAETKISYMKIGYPTKPGEDWFTSLDWRAGRGTYKNVMNKPLWNGTRGGNPKADVLITGNGGGRFYGLNSYMNGDRTYHPDHRRLLIIGTKNPLALYGPNVEDGHGDWQFEIDSCENIAIYGYKSEDTRDLYITNCDNIIVFGHGGSVEIFVEDSNRIYMGNIAPKKWTRWGTTDVLDSRKILTEVYNGHATEFSADRIITLYKRGEADFGVFRLGEPDPPDPEPPKLTMIINLWDDGTYTITEVKS